MMPALKVSSDQEGKRLDVVLARVYPDYSRAFLQKWIKEGRVTSAGHGLIPNHRVRVGETIEVTDFGKIGNPSPPPSPLLKGRGRSAAQGEGFIRPVVLFEDEVILVLNKPAGLVVHPAPSHKGPTLVDWLAEYLGAKVTGLFKDASRLGVVHRLDKDTTGVLLVAKTVSAQNLIGKQFQDRRIQKTYAAFVEGIPAAASGIISAPVGRSHNAPNRMAVSSSGRPSETTFEVVKTFKEVSQVSLHPKTGRTHQIRVHCAAIGHPIVGDSAYGSSPRWARDYGIGRPLLHAERLEIQHPVTRKKTAFEAPWPDDMKKAQALFRRSLKLVLITVCLAGAVMPARADDNKPAPKSKSSHASPSPTGGQIYTSVKTLKSEMTSLHSQFKALIEEVSALQDRVTSIQSGLDQLEASRRLHDLEKALSDLNGKAAGVSSVAEEAKSQALDLSRKLKAQQEALDVLREQVDRLQRELNETKARAEEPAPQAPVTKP
jgi:23S rRNA pseudouridine1911/1915/1917 synthase